MVVEELARIYNATPWRAKFQGELCETVIASEKVLLLKPQTFMNESGRSAQEVMQFYKIPLQHLVVFHDELDLQAARIRVKTGGGEGGHNGLRSITACCGPDYKRVRLGIGHPGHKSQVHSYVLNDFAKNEVEWVQGLTKACALYADCLVKGQDSSFQNKIHLEMTGKGLYPET